MRSSIESARPRAAAADRARNPAELEVSGRARAIGQARRKFASDRCGVLAANLACRGLLSLLSAVIALLGLTGLLHVGAGVIHRLVDGVTRALPPGASGALSQAVSSAGSQSYRSSLVALIAGIVVAAWSGLGLMAALQTDLATAYGAPAGGKVVARWLRGVPLLLCTVVLGGVASAVLIFGQPIGAEIEAHVGLTGAAFVGVWTAVRWIIAIALFGFLLACCYFFGQSKPLARWRWVSMGGLAATAIFLIASAGLSFYVARFGLHGRVYGSLAGVGLLAAWLYAVSLAVLIGAELNAQTSAVRPGAATARTAAATAVGQVNGSPASIAQPVQPVAQFSVFEPRVPRTQAWRSATGTAWPQEAAPTAAASEPHESTAAVASEPHESAAAVASEPHESTAAAAMAEQQEPAAQRLEAVPAGARAAWRAPAPTAQPEKETAASMAEPQADRASVATAGRPDGGLPLPPLPPLPRRVPGQSLRERRT